MFGWEFPPVISGGLGTVCYALTRHLAAAGTDVTFVMPRVGAERAEFDNFTMLGANEVVFEQVPDVDQLAGNLPLRVVETDSALRPYDSDATYTARLKQIDAQPLSQPSGITLAFDGGYAHDLLEEVTRLAMVGGKLGEEADFDVIHAHDWMTYAAGLEARQASGKPLICHVHATEFDRTANRPDARVAEIEKAGLDAADRVIAVSRRTRDSIVAHYDIDSAKIDVVHNAVSKERLVDPDTVPKYLGEKIVLFLGRVTLQKGPEYFVEAARRVLARVPDVRFVMAGSGDMLPQLIELVAQYRIQDRFHFTGFLRGADVHKVYAMSDLYIMPSVSEPFGVAPFEAMLYGVPVIISKDAGAVELLDNAATINFWDIDELSATIIRVLEDDTYANALRRAGAEVLEHIDWHRTAAAVIDVYKRTIAAATTRTPGNLTD
jgi:glycogen(starch) synthase